MDSQPGYYRDIVRILVVAVQPVRNIVRILVVAGQPVRILCGAASQDTMGIQSEYYYSQSGYYGDLLGENFSRNYVPWSSPGKPCPFVKLKSVKQKMS